MKRETLIWTIVFVLGGLGLLYNGAIRQGGMAKQYVAAEPVNPDKPDGPQHYVSRTPLEHDAHPQTVFFSTPRTIGIWFAAFLTLCIFSFLYKDNPFYKFAESVFIGVSAASYMVAAFWEQIVPNLLGELVPKLMKMSLYPAAEIDPSTPWKFWARLACAALGVMLLWRLAPKGQWIARWPLAVIIGTMAGIRTMVFIQTDLLGVVSSTVMPLVALHPAGGLDFWQSLRQTCMVLGVLACLFYFFFSIEHKGVPGRIARVGIWVLMITFGASFGLTVMGRIALLSERLIFLFDDWLWWIDPTHARHAAAMLMWCGMV